jgi:hypothetical protein
MANLSVQQVTFSAQVPVFVADGLDKLGKQYGMSRAEFVREILRDCAALSRQIMEESNVRS